MSFNPDPTKQAVQLIFSRKKKPPNHPLILFNDIPISKTEEHKHLGLILYSKLSFNSHIKSVISKSRRGIGLIKYLSNYLPRHALKDLYMICVRPHLEYGDVVCHIPATKCEYAESFKLNHLMEKLESVQYSAALAITGAWKGTSQEKLYNELGWDSLNLRRWSLRVVLYFKFVNNLTPRYTRQPIPPLTQSKYRLRRPNIIGQIRARTTSFSTSFYPNCPSEWNELDSKVRQSPTLDCFKKKILSLIRPPLQPVFSIHDPKGLAVLTQLRVGLSKLNFHKFKHNFKDTVNPMCLINDGNDDAEHYLWLCCRNDEQRKGLLDAISILLQPLGFPKLPSRTLLKILLYGDDRSPLISNTRILEATLLYIYATERFE